LPVSFGFLRGIGLSPPARYEMPQLRCHGRSLLLASQQCIKNGKKMLLAASAVTITAGTNSLPSCAVLSELQSIFGITSSVLISGSELGQGPAVKSPRNSSAPPCLGRVG